MIKIIIGNNEFYKEIEYVFKIIQNIIGINWGIINKIDETNSNDILINYGEKLIERTNVINILSSNLFTNLYLDRKSIPNKRLNKYNGIPIIYMGGEKIKSPYVNKKDNIIVTNIDIIQSIFFMITRYEEIVLWDEIEKDLYERFPSTESLAYKEGFLNVPIVNEYIEFFWNWLKLLGYKGEKKNHFGKYDFAACLTHDVDMPFKYRNSLKEHMKVFKSRRDTPSKYKEIINHTISNINYKKDPFFTFDYIRKIEKKYKFNSSFYFMSGGNSIYDNFYNIYDDRIVKLIKKLENDKCEVGYHYSFKSHDDIDMRMIEKMKIDKFISSKTYGGRNHFLRFTPLESWKICEEVGLLYDTTLSYADYDGFRCGTCFPFKPYDIKERRVINIWEIPLIVMDGTLKDKKYRNLNCEDALKQITEKIDIIKKYNGVFTLLWHNSSFDKEHWNGWNTVFEKIMEYLYSSNAVGVSGRELIYMIKEQE